MMAKAVGCKKGDIMFSSNDTPEKEFKYADEIGGIINLDDITHIESVERALGKIPEVISCRYNPVEYLRSAMVSWIIREMPSMV